MHARAGLLRLLCTAAGSRRGAGLLVPAPHPATVAPDLLRKECSIKHTRGSGPGGQHRNKVATAVVLTHEPTAVGAQASESRSQNRNAQVALWRLRLRLAVEARTDPPPAEPSDLWRARRTGDGRIVVNDQHADFPALIAEALDAACAPHVDVRAAATSLGVSTSQLVRLIAREPKALQAVNDARAAHGLAPLRNPNRRGE